MSSATFDTVTANTVVAGSLGGQCLASAAEAQLNIANKAVTPATLRVFAQAPPVTIGGIAPSAAKFTSVVADSLSGGVIATELDLVNGTTDTVITPAVLRTAMSNPSLVTGGAGGDAVFADVVITGKLTTSNYPVGAASGGTGQSKYFIGDLLAASSQTTLDRVPIGQPGQFLTVDTGAPTKVRWAQLPTLSAATTSSPGIIPLATASEAVGATITTKAVTPATLAAAMRSPVAIGATYPNAGTFTAITAGSISGNVVATNTDAVAHMSKSKVITPANIPYIMAAPGPIGGNTASTGVFTTVDATTVSTVNLNVVNPPWAKLMVQYAVNSDMTKGLLTNKAATPASVKYLLQNPLPIGGTTPNVGTFTTLNATTLNVKNPPWVPLIPLPANLASTAHTSANTYVSPNYLFTEFASPPVIGSATPNDAMFARVVANNVYSIVGDQTNAVQGYFTSLEAVTIGGDVVATNDMAIARTDFQHVLVPGNVPALFANPGPLGTDVASSASFTDLTANTIAGAVVATAEELYNATDNQKVVTPYALDQYLHAPNVIGQDTPNAGSFTQLTAQTFQGDAVATVQEIADASANNLVVSPAGLGEYWASPNALGATAPNAAYFTSLAAASLAGDVQATVADLIVGTVDNKVIAPNTLVGYLHTPGVIGDVTPNAGTFTDLVATESLITPALQVDSITGAAIATLDQVIEGLIEDRVVVPSTLHGCLLAPPVIGLDLPNDAFFVAVTAATVNGEVVASTAEIAAGAINYKVVSPAGLVSFLEAPTPIGSGTPSTGAFTKLSAEIAYAQLGDSSSDADAWINNLVVTSVEGPAIATDAQALSGTGGTLLTPTTLAAVFASPPVVGSLAPNNAQFLNVNAQSIDGSAVGALSDLQNGSAANIVPSCKAVHDFLQSPIAIGSVNASDAYFNALTAQVYYGQVGDSERISDVYAGTLNAWNLGGPVIATTEQAYDASLTALAITPATLMTVMTHPPALGDGTTSATFDQVTANNLIGPLGNETYRYNAYVDILDCNGIGGGIVADQDTVNAGIDNSKAVCASTLFGCLASPPPIGAQAPNTGNFSTLTAFDLQGTLGDPGIRNDAFVSSLDIGGSVLGNAMATLYDVNGTNGDPPTDKIVSPAVLMEYLNAPNAIGSSAPNMGYFSTVISNAFLGPLGDNDNMSDAWVATLNVQTLTGDIIATASDILAGTDSLVTGSALVQYLEHPGALTLGGGSIAVEASSVTTPTLLGCGSVPADVYSGVADTTYVSPATLHSVLYYPDPGFTFGGGTPIVINAASVSTQALSGPFIGSESDIATSTGKLVTGAAVNSWMTDLPSVGHLSNSVTGTVGTVGKFSSVTAKTIYANVGDATVQGQGFFEVLTCERLAGAVLSTYNDYSLRRTDGIVSPALLADVVDQITQGGMDVTLGNVTVNTINLGDMILPPLNGGTGIIHYAKGDLLVGLNDALVRIGVGGQIDSQVLQVDSNASLGLRWGNAPYAPRHLKMSPPRYVTNSGNRFLINWTHARSMDNTANIDIETGQTINVSTVGANGVLQSGTLGGTVSASGNTVTSADTDLSSLFMVGDVLFVESLSQARRVIGITSSSQMEVESAFNGSVSGATFRRGGLAPNTHYYLYAAATYYFMSTRCQYLGDPLLDFTGVYAQTPYVVTTDSNANVYQTMYTAERVSMVPYAQTFSVGTSYQYFDASTSVPRTAISVRLLASVKNSSSGVCDLRLRCTTSDAEMGLPGVPAGGFASVMLDVPVDYFQRFQAMTTQSVTCSLTVVGYATNM